MTKVGEGRRADAGVTNAGHSPSVPGAERTQLVAAFLVAVATPIVIVGAALALLLTPAWIGFEQERSGVPALTGFPPDQVRRVTGSIGSDLVAGPPSFAVAVGGQPVLDASERSHMADVRGVLVAFGAGVAIALAALLVLVVPNRHRPWAWRSVSRGAAALALAVVGLGAWVVVSFDTAFLAFHLVAFPEGNFSFDPRTERLVQLFPEQFWSDSAIAMGVLLLTASIATAAIAERVARRRPRPDRVDPSFLPVADPIANQR